MTATSTRKLLVFAGERMNSSGKRRFVYYDVTNGVPDPYDPGEEMWYAKSLYHAAVGSIIGVHVNDNDSIMVSGDSAPRYVDRLDDVPAEWRAKHETARTMIDAQARANRAKRDDRGLGSLTLDQLAVEYRKTISRSRGNALLAAIIGHVTSTRVADIDTE